MIKSEPKTILFFLQTHFDFLKSLFFIQSKNGDIDNDFFYRELKSYKIDIKNQLFTYQILKETDHGFQIRDTYYQLFAFLLQQFKPLLPEEIEKYSLSIRNLFLKVKNEIDGNKNILLERIDTLNNEIEKFISQVQNNTQALLTETEKLKANLEKIDYNEKAKKTEYWIDYYIDPLNKILDAEHSESIFNLLLQIKNYANDKRLIENPKYLDENLRQKFEDLYHKLETAKKDITEQLKILVEALLPLLEKIKKENSILKGMYKYLSNNYCHKKDSLQPQLPAKIRGSAYNKDFSLLTKEYFEQFQTKERATVNTQVNHYNEWIFITSHYKNEMIKKLPIENFFSWALDKLKNNCENPTANNYLKFIPLLFEEEIEVQYQNHVQSIVFKNENHTLQVPVLRITKNEKQLP